MRRIARVRGRTRNSALLRLIVVLVALQTSLQTAITPLLPTYKATLHLTTTETGWLFAAFPAGAALASIALALLARSAEPRTTVLAGTWAFAASATGFAVAHQLTLLMLARTVQGATDAAIWIAGSTWLVSASPQAPRGRLLGAMAAASTAGGFIGPSVSSALHYLAPRYGLVLFAVPALPLAVWLAHTPAPLRTTPTSRSQRVYPRPPHTRPPLYPLAVVGLAASLFALLYVLGPLRLASLGASLPMLGATFSTQAGCCLAMSTLAGRLCDRFDPSAVLRVSALSSTVALLATAFTSSVWLLACLVVAASLPFVSLLVAAQTLVSRRVNDALASQTAAFAAMNLAWASGEAASSAAASAVAATAGFAAPYVTAAAVALLGALPEPARVRLSQTSPPAHLADFGDPPTNARKEA